jgi:hypothetical protein
MDKESYLRDADVHAFVEWMGQHLKAGSPIGHGYARPGLPPLWFDNLSAAFGLYEWPFSFKRIDGQRCSGRTFAENDAVLADLQRRLRGALAAKDSAALCDAAVEVVRWGGVAPRNEDWLRDNEHGLVALLGRVKEALEKQDDEADLGPELRFNAGMTKVYSLLLDHFIIYDSRVAAALAWFVAAWTRENGLGSVPPSLRFRCMTAKEDPKAARQKQRNPWRGKLGFPHLGSQPYVHAKWNLRASWIVERLLESQRATSFGFGPAASRKLEAALFMWGYDLPIARPDQFEMIQAPLSRRAA